MGVYIPNMEKPKDCRKCPRIVKYDDGWSIRKKCLELNREIYYKYDDRVVMQDDCPLIEIDLVRCGECEHRPIKDDPDGEDYGFNIVEPTDGDDICPCLVEDGWYSWMPKDNFYCGRGERNEDFDPYQGERDRDENGEIY